MLTQFPFKFEYERINGYHWNATVDAIADMKISIGSTAIDCTGSIYMLGTYQE